MLNKNRKFIRNLKLPKNADPRSLAESLTDEFAVASISGSHGEFEIQFVSPEELVVVVGPSQARFFLEPLPLNADFDEEDDERDDPHDVAEEISFHFARFVGRLKEDTPDENEGPNDDSDDIARQMIQRLLDEGLLEIVNARSRSSVEAYLAHKIAHGQTGDNLGDDLTEVKGVAELYASNEELARILAECRKKRVPTMQKKLAGRRGASKK